MLALKRCGVIDGREMWRVVRKYSQEPRWANIMGQSQAILEVYSMVNTTRGTKIFLHEKQSIYSRFGRLTCVKCVRECSSRCQIVVILDIKSTCQRQVQKKISKHVGCYAQPHTILYLNFLRILAQSQCKMDEVHWSLLCSHNCLVWTKGHMNPHMPLV